MVLCHILLCIYDITNEDIEKKDNLLSNRLLTKMNSKLGFATLIKKTNGEYVVTNTFYDILHSPKKDIHELFKDFKNNILNKDDLIMVQKFELNEINYFEKVIEYKSPFYHKTQQLFLYLETYEDTTNKISFINIKDVTDEYEKENELKVLLNDQKVLIKEVHHRVKNNLQIILSLLNLELRFHDGDYEWILNKTRNRISTMATIHQQVYDSSDSAHVDALKCTEVCLQKLFGSDNSNIKFHLDVESHDLSMDKAIPFSLILNELAMNSINFAFKENEEGNFYVKFGVYDDMYELDIWDDGVGLPEGTDIKNPKTLGFTIIKSLISQLDGEYNELPLSKGFGIKIIFKNVI